MPPPAHRVQERTFREGIASYVKVLCREGRVRRDNVEDLVQEALTQIVASIASFQPEMADLDTWGRGVARNVVRRYLRDAKRYAARFSEYHSNMDEHPVNAPSPERCVQRIEARCLLSSAAQSLSDRQVDILMLHAVDGLSHKEIGSKFEIEEGACQKRYQRARNHMAQCLAGEILSVMPSIDTSCNDVSAPNDNASQFFDWAKWSHYSGQMGAAIIAFFLFLPAQSLASVTGEIKTVSERVIYQQDKPSVTPDKPAAYPDVLSGKPEPASLPSVRATPARTKSMGKPTPGGSSVSRSPYKHVVSSSVNLPPG